MNIWNTLYKIYRKIIQAAHLSIKRYVLKTCLILFVLIYTKPNCSFDLNAVKQNETSITNRVFR